MIHPQELQDHLNDRAEAFSKEFAHAGYEMGQAQNFVRELCGVYGLNYLRSVDFERRVAKDSGVAYLFKLYEKLTLAPMLEPAEGATSSKKPRQTSFKKTRQPT